MSTSTHEILQAVKEIFEGLDFVDSAMFDENMMRFSWTLHVLHRVGVDLTTIHTLESRHKVEEFVREEYIHALDAMLVRIIQAKFKVGGI